MRNTKQIQNQNDPMSKTDCEKYPWQEVNSGDALLIRLMFWSLEFRLFKICFEFRASDLSCKAF